MYVLGISAFYHDSAAALLLNGNVIAAAQEERFTRKKHDPSFPSHSICYCLREAGIQIGDLQAVVFYDKPLIKFERLLETYLAFAPKGFLSFIAAMPIWLKEKVFLKSLLKKELTKLSGLSLDQLPTLLFSEHHQSHAASAFFPSPFDEAAVLCLDGVGEWATMSAWRGVGNSLTPLWEQRFPHSLGLLYSAFTSYAGFKVNSGEYKLMGLAPYGVPKYVELILNHLLDLKEDGTFQLDMSYFDYATGLTMTSPKFHKLFGGPPRAPEGKLGQKDMDIARSIQQVTEEIVLRLARTLHRETGAESLCLAGGVALNCVANGRLLREGPFREIWIQPAAGDAGGSLGCAMAAWYQYFKNPRSPSKENSKSQVDRMSGSYLGPRQSCEEIESYLGSIGASFQKLSEHVLLHDVAELLSKGNVVGWVQGRMEFGPRALGSRSILGDPRNPEMQSVMNLKIKHRESFRPFAPAVLAEDVSEYFELDRPSPYMLLVAGIRKNLRVSMTEEQCLLFGVEKLKVSRSSLPAITHIDYSARVQTVDASTQPRFHALLKEFKSQTGCSVLVNTSFNVRGEPIVCTAEDAYRCFMRTEMDYLVIEDFVLRRTDQPKWIEKSNWKREFELD